MKKLKSSLCILLLVFACYQANAQKFNETEKYFLFFKTWNFLKYYHPQFTKGIEDADAIFMKKQNLIGNIHNKAELNIFLMGMITELGEDEEMQHNGGFKLPNNNVLHNWYIKNGLINSDLKKKLLNVYTYRDTVGKHYVPALNYTTEIPNERKYKFPDSINLPLGMRLLALAKLQGVIDYLYPHKRLINEPWDQAVKKNILLFKNCASRMDYEVLLLKIIAKLNDTHAYNRFYDDLTYKKEIFKNKYYPPFDYQIINNKILVKEIIVPDLCTKAGIKVGDLITAIDGVSINKNVDRLKQLLSASNRNTLIFKINNYVTNFMWSNDSSKFQLIVSSSGQKKEVLIDFVTSKNTIGIQAINNYLIAKLKVTESISPFKVMESGIAYFNIENIRGLLNDVKDDHLDAKMDSILNLAAEQQAIIFDMRGYPSWGGFVFHYIYKKFGNQHNLFAQYFQADNKNLGSFLPIAGTFTYYPGGVKTESFNYTGKVCIIVNPDTRSLSEWNTMNLQHIFPNAITIGEQTAGADGDEKHINIPGNYNIYFTGNAIYYPDGTLAQGKGVKINKIVRLKIEDLCSGKDTQLNFAIKSVL
ncbi:hypothetical protein ASE74_01210 [Pedobacter sp. Leaf216]|uniref:S41 family peptidase n=1 Tax=Pedobacter sp. Leaf216 TaxID=1735684 RepID=UPI0006F856C9|nr:S41 family peptidase [Pedobacter sp. Leaf216]KQM74633.1 hypothetical protein ASE74_01210 [Pedobacter sp. Leaf216]